MVMVVVRKKKGGGVSEGCRRGKTKVIEKI